MKLLTISSHQLEIARTHLRKPFLTVGRSPSCDVLLRAPGVQAIHFLIEWIGSGDFDPSQGMWSITDISASYTQGNNDGHDAGEGLVFSEHPVKLQGFTFTCIEDHLEDTASIGGRIAENLTTNRAKTSEILEVVQVRTDSGAIEEIKHFPIQNQRKRESLLPQVREFKVEWIKSKNLNRSSGESFLRVLLQEMPGAQVYSRGQPLETKGSCELKHLDVLLIQWRGMDFYIRLVEAVNSPPIRTDLFGDPLLRRLMISVGVLGIFFFVTFHILPKKQHVESNPPLRVARVEIAKSPQAAPTVTPTPTPTPLQASTPTPQPPPPQPAPRLHAPAKTSAPKAHLPPKTSGAPAAPRFLPKNRISNQKGINSPAPISDVNSVGVLGALKKVGPKGPGIQANEIINNGIVTEAVAGAETSKIVLKNPPSGTFAGTAKKEFQGSPQGDEESNLGSASTTLSGVKKYDPRSMGAIASQEGTSGLKIDTGFGNQKGNQKTTSTPSDGSEVGDGGDFTVEGGGLDRDTVRNVISSYRGQIRTCYERALLTRNNLEGRIVYEWRIGTDGHVVTTQVIRSTIHSPNLASCVQDVIKQMTFPKASNNRPTRVIYPFVFQGKK